LEAILADHQLFWDSENEEVICHRFLG
jgi:hypothetical protein